MDLGKQYSLSCPIVLLFKNSSPRSSDEVYRLYTSEWLMYARYISVCYPRVEGWHYLSEISSNQTGAVVRGVWSCFCPHLLGPKLRDRCEERRADSESCLYVVVRGALNIL